MRKTALPSRRRGSAITEFAVLAPALFGLFAGTYSIGNGLSRMVQASGVCRSANVLAARGFDLARPENQRLLVGSAAGLGLNVIGTLTVNPDGKAVIYLTRVVKVGVQACAKGVGGWTGDPSQCANYRKYVIAGRVAIGNARRWPSAMGRPGSSLDARGELSDQAVAMVTANRADGFSDLPGQPTIVRLMDDEQAFVAEVFVDAQDLTIPYLFQMQTIRARNVS